MNYWKRLRLIGSVIVLAIAVLAVLVAVVYRSDSADDTPSGRPQPALRQPSVNNGL
jgi:hypothetical protein